MRRIAICIAALLIGSGVASAAADRTFQVEVEKSLKSSVPKDWFLRASWRDATLVVFVSPPISQSFEIWYDSSRQKSVLEGLCRALPQTIWGKVASSQDIAMEQVVGGNGGKGSWRLSCRQYLVEIKGQQKTN